MQHQAFPEMKIEEFENQPKIKLDSNSSKSLGPKLEKDIQLMFLCKRIGLDLHNSVLKFFTVFGNEGDRQTSMIQMVRFKLLI